MTLGRAGDWSRVEERVKRCVECCLNLVVYVEDGTFRFAHITVKHFLEFHGIPD
jgi:hypothetical protein